MTTRRDADATTTEPAAFLPLPARDYLIMFALSAGPLHGYGLLKALEAQSGGVVRFDPANLYRSLRKLERDGLVVEVDAEPGGDPDGRRRSFDLTSLGLDVLRTEAVRLAGLAEAARDRELLTDTRGPR